MIGNGEDTVAALIDHENARPERSGTGHSPLKPLPGVDYAKDLLKAQNLKPTSVPEKGRSLSCRIYRTSPPVVSLSPYSPKCTRTTPSWPPEWHACAGWTWQAST